MKNKKGKRMNSKLNKEGIGKTYAGGIDDNLAHSPNTDLDGVCAGYQVCGQLDGVWGMHNSYLIDPDSVPGQENYFTSYTNPDGLTQNQFVLYDAVEQCDFYDNDCNGIINDDIECSLGNQEAAIIADLAGNTFIDPVSWSNPYDGTVSPETQVLSSFDQLLLTVLVDEVYGKTSCGGPNQKFCNTFLSANEIWVCSD